MRSILLATGTLALAVAAPLGAQTMRHADPASIDRSVAEFTGHPIGVPGGAVRPVDRRLKLAPCVGPLVLGWHDTRQDNVRVQCSDTGGWRLFVPVRQGAAGYGTGAGGAAQGGPIVVRGEAVTIVMRGRGFSVASGGEAMEAGAQGAWIRVRPTGSKEAVRAQVERPGTVVIPLS